MVLDAFPFPSHQIRNNNVMRVCICVCFFFENSFFRLSHFYFYSFLSSHAHTNPHTRQNNIKQINIKHRAHHQHHVKCYFICLLYFEYIYIYTYEGTGTLHALFYFQFFSFFFLLLFSYIIVVVFRQNTGKEKENIIKSKGNMSTKEK